jgi:hypothetical protein
MYSKGEPKSEMFMPISLLVAVTWKRGGFKETVAKDVRKPDGTGQRKYVIPYTEEEEQDGDLYIYFWFKDVVTPATVILKDRVPIEIPVDKTSLNTVAVSFEIPERRQWMGMNLRELYVQAMTHDVQEYHLEVMYRRFGDDVRLQTTREGYKVGDENKKLKTFKPFDRKVSGHVDAETNRLYITSQEFGEQVVDIPMHGMTLIEDRCTFNEKVGSVTLVAEGNVTPETYDWTATKFRNTVYLPLLAEQLAAKKEDGPVGVVFDPFRYNNSDDTKSSSSGDDGAIVSFHRGYDVFTSREELLTTLGTIVDEKSLIEACDKYGPFLRWNVAHIDDLSHVFDPTENHKYEVNPECNDYFRELKHPVPKSPTTDELTERKEQRMQMFTMLSHENSCPIHPGDVTLSKCILDLSCWTFSQTIANLSGMFMRCKAIQAVRMPPLSVLRDFDASDMFRDCNCLKSALLQLRCCGGGTGRDDDKKIANNLSTMFACCITLTDVVLDVKNCRRVKCTETFEHCNTLRSVKMPDCLVLTRAKNMFAHCYSLEKLIAPNMRLDDVYAAERMFHKCSSLPSATIPFVITVNAHRMKAIAKDFQGIMNNILFASTQPDQPAVNVLVDCKEPLVVHKSSFLKFLRTLLVGTKGTLTQSIAVRSEPYRLLIFDDTMEEGKYRLQSYDSYGQLVLY